MLLAFALVVLVNVQILSTFALDISLLNDDLGRTPCDLVDVVQISCSNSRRNIGLLARDDDSHLPTATNCSCNNVFYNVWNACLITKTNTSWVCSSATWKNACKTESFTVQSEQYSSASPFPSWAYLPMPNNASFDIFAAVTLAEDKAQQPGTSKLQIIIPVSVGLAVLLLFCLCLWLYHRKFSSSMEKRTYHGTVPSRRFDFSWPGKRKVIRVASRGKSWEIDDDMEAFQLVSTPSHTPLPLTPPPKPHNFSPKPFQLVSTPSHTRLPSTPPAKPHDLILTPKPPREAEVASPGKSLLKSVQHAGLSFAFWKRKPIRVRSRLPDARFDIDAEPQVKKQPKTTPKITSPLLRSSPLFSPRYLQVDAGDPLFEHNDIDSDNEQDRIQVLSDDDDSSLIQPAADRADPSVLLVSNRSANFTISGETASELIEVVPPSPSRQSHGVLPEVQETPKISRPGHRHERSRSQPRTPPAPNYPAPLPPTSPTRPIHSLSPDRPSSSLPQEVPAHARQLSNESTSSLASRSSRRLPRPPELVQPQTRHTRNDSLQPSTSSLPRRRPLPSPGLPNIRVPAPPYHAEPAQEESVLASSPISRPILLSSDENLRHSRSGSEERVLSGSGLLFAEATGQNARHHASSDSLNLFLPGSPGFATNL